MQGLFACWIMLVSGRPRFLVVLCLGVISLHRPLISKTQRRLADWPTNRPQVPSPGSEAREFKSGRVRLHSGEDGRDRYRLKLVQVID